MFLSKQIAIIGGGAAGCFCAVNIAAIAKKCNITIFESMSTLMYKLALTGGGRCNITNTFDDVDNLKMVYSRGANLMKRLFYTFDNSSTIRWFAEHGVDIVAEQDGRMFPKSQNAMQVVDTLLKCINKYGVAVKTEYKLIDIALSDTKYALKFGNGNTELFDIVVIATGGSSSAYLQMFAKMGIEIVLPVPSLFTFTINDKMFNNLMGVTIDNVSCMLAGTKFKTEGSLLITHWGVSGPAVLKLSSVAAQYLHNNKYTSTLIINWINQNFEQVYTILINFVSKYPQRAVGTLHPQGITNRLWNYLLFKTGLDVQRRWGEVSKKTLNRLVLLLVSDSYKIQGRGHYREEFVTCGGISLSEVDSSTLCSKKYQNLYFAGEILDIDAVTGGFNLQAAWTTGYTVAQAILGNDGFTS